MNDDVVDAGQKLAWANGHWPYIAAWRRAMVDEASGSTTRRTRATEEWESNQSVDGASCFIRGENTGEYHVRCIINNEATPAVVAAFRQSAETAIDSCLSAIPNAGTFTKSFDNDDLSKNTRWIKKDGDFITEISVSEDQDEDDKSLSNSLFVGWGLPN